MKKLLSTILLFTFLLAPVAIALALATEETVWITITGQRYHYENCRTLRGDKMEIPVAEARELGYTLCVVCRRQSEVVESHSIDISPNSLHFVRVVRVIDGDTITVEFQNGTRPERLRLIGVDTPETVHPQRGVEHYGREALDFTTTTLTEHNQYVWLQFDVGIRDRFQRYLGYVWTEKPNDVDDEAEIRDKMFNARLLLGGYAQVMTIQPNVRYAELFVQFQREAREANKGLWE